MPRPKNALQTLSSCCCHWKQARICFQEMLDRARETSQECLLESPRWRVLQCSWWLTRQQDRLQCSSLSSNKESARALGVDGHRAYTSRNEVSNLVEEVLVDSVWKQRNEGGPSELELQEEGNGAMRSGAHEFGLLKVRGSK